MFLDKFANEKKKNLKFFNKEAIKIIENHDWEGNVRELQNTIERIVLLYDGNEVIPEYLRFLTSDKEVDPFATSLNPGHIVLPPDRIDLKSL